MSHFFTLVVTDDYPTQEVLEKVMQPFHQHECTGINGQYVVDVDITEEAKSSYEEHKENEQTPFKQFLDGWYGENGYFLKDEKVYTKTNPNYKWDWWQVGGRYSGRLGAYKPEENPNNWEKCFICNGTGMRMDDLGIKARKENPDYSCNGCNGKGTSLKWPTCFEKYDGDICQVKDINLDTIRMKNVTDRFDFLKETCTKHNISLAELEDCLRAFQKEHEEYKNNPNKEWNEVTYSEKAMKYQKADIWRELYLVNVPLVDWANSAPSLISFAVNDNGKWSERGEMGWWGVVSNENDSWEKEYQKFLNSLKPDQYLTVVDCHI